ncbi:MAG: hypothetical protein ACRDWN_04445 [Acidimicrobiales bacterium]
MGAVTRSYLAARSPAPATAAGPLPVVPALAGLLPDQGLRRGSVLGISGPGGSLSLLLATLAGPLSAGSWGAVVGVPGLGAEAAAGLGVRLDRLALVPDPGPRWTEVVGALLEAVEIVAVAPPGRCRPPDARRLAARARDRHGVLVVVEHPFGPARHRWPEPVDVRLDAGPATWNGLGDGDGALVCRETTVRASGRRSGREREARLWLPAAHGGVAAAGGERIGPAAAAMHRPAPAAG